ncbi:methyltransferase domain-containing protein [Gilvimarinus agarilyticus]|uniref:methyltransferase domain-containing protein n=1 Tax=Gilvimarinus agarilyticus TaxID=679259 RepID=UPI0006986D8E|nr:methyltransferase domain-containing protein [Gilvimarinus agarilyticus]
MDLFNYRDRHGQHYRVVRAGQTVRLYSDGVFHTQYHPNREFDGSVWDLLWLPTTLLADQQVRRILVLGVGGGAVVRKLRQRYPRALIIGVDINPVHLQIARQFFAAGGPNTLLLEADAIAFMKVYRGPGFDVIVDDLFAASEGEPTRVVDMSSQWARALCRALTRRGLLVVNFAANAELKTAWRSLGEGAVGFAQALEWRHRRYENCIGAFYRQPLTPGWKPLAEAVLPASRRRDYCIAELCGL